MAGQINYRSCSIENLSLMADSAGNETLAEDKRGDIILILFVAVCGAVFFGVLSYSTDTHSDPSFSAKLTDVGGLDPLHSPVVRPDFDLTLLVDNPKETKMCRNNVTATVFYGNVIFGWGRVPDFCMDKYASTHMKVMMSHADVMLTDRLRTSLASEQRAGELEVSVELRMLIPEHAKESMQFCRVHPGQCYALCRCTVLTSHHWRS